MKMLDFLKQPLGTDAIANGDAKRRGHVPDNRRVSSPTPSLLQKAARPAKALLAAMGLVALQLLSDALVAKTGWPVPGALIGLLVLLCGLALADRVPQALDDVSTPLLKHLMLLLIPSVTAVGLYASQMVQHLTVFLLASTVVTALTLAATALVLQRLMKRTDE